MADILLTGFEPFAGDAVNPSGLIAAALHGTSLLPGHRVHGLVLPVSAATAFARTSRLVRRLRPHWIVAMGVSGRDAFTPESQAVNAADYRIPDNAGLQLRAVPLLKRGPVILRTGLDAEKLAAAAARTGIPAIASTDAGRFVCNHLYYRLLHLTSRPGHPAAGRTVFIHLPALPGMQGKGKTQELPALQTAVLSVLRSLRLHCYHTPSE